jgi:hypothetical protein
MSPARAIDSIARALDPTGSHPDHIDARETLCCVALATSPPWRRLMSAGRSRLCRPSAGPNTAPIPPPIAAATAMGVSRSAPDHLGLPAKISHAAPANKAPSIAKATEIASSHRRLPASVRRLATMSRSHDRLEPDSLLAGSVNNQPRATE